MQFKTTAGDCTGVWILVSTSSSQHHQHHRHHNYHSPLLCKSKRSFVRVYMRVCVRSDEIFLHYYLTRSGIDDSIIPRSFCFCLAIPEHQPFVFLRPLSIRITNDTGPKPVIVLTEKSSDKHHKDVT